MQQKYDKITDDMGNLTRAVRTKVQLHYHQVIDRGIIGGVYYIPDSTESTIFITVLIRTTTSPSLEI